MTDSYVPSNAEREAMREKVAVEYGFALYRQYGEKQAAGFIGIDLSTLKRWRRNAIAKSLDFPFVRFGVDGVRYMGFHIADIILKGTDKWPNEPDDMPNASSSANTGLESERVALPTTAAGESETALSASASARRILRKQSSS
jgi:hypothetical protein